MIGSFRLIIPTMYMRLAMVSRTRANRVSVSVVTWLILPVVICLSQRLSHACLSISNLYSETANGSLIQLWSTRHQIYHLDNRGNSIANTCERNGDFGSHAVIRYKPTWGKTQSWWLIVTCRSNCVDSTFDFLPYHGSVYGSGVHWQ